MSNPGVRQLAAAFISQGLSNQAKASSFLQHARRSAASKTHLLATTVRMSGNLVLLFVFAGLSPLVCLADTLTGEVRGTVLDIEGRVLLAGASVTLTNTDRGWKKQLLTDANGNYVFIQLDPGNYSVLAEKEAYYPSERTDVLIRLNTPKVVIPPIELRKKVATPTQQITLRGEQTKTAIVDLTAPGPTPVILAVLNAPGLTSLVSLLDAALRFNYENLLVQDLPLIGARTFDQLALFSPGVFRVPFSSGQGPAVGIGVGSGGQFSVNGLRSRSNNFTVDGSDNNDEDIGVRRQGFVALVPQSIESIQEFQIITAGFPAEFGRNSGSMVNAVSRSGQKNLHGSLYGIFNDALLNAQDYFEHNFADAVNSGELNGGSFAGKDSNSKHYGGSLGGPIKGQNVFYFVSLEQQRHHGKKLGHFLVPAAGERGLRINNGFVPVDQLGSFFREHDINYYSDQAGKGIFSLYPLPNNPAGPFDANNYSQAKKWLQNGSIFSGKSDWRISSVHSFVARYNFTDDRSIIPFTGESINSSVGTSTCTQNISLFLNSTAPRFGSVLRFSYGRTRLAFPPEDGSPLLFGSAPSDQLPPALNQVISTPYGRFGPFGSTGPIGQISILPYSSIGVDAFNFPQGRVDNTFQMSDFITRTGTWHTLKLGFDIRRSQLNSFSDRNSRPLLLFGYGIVSDGCTLNPDCIFGTPDGLLRGTDLAALGAPAGFLQTISTGPVADTTIGLRFTQYDFFAQDVWKLRSNLTLSLGLRYEMQSVPSEVNGRIERSFSLTPDQVGHLEPTGSDQNKKIIQAGNQAFDAAMNALRGFLDGRNRIYQPDQNNLGPRAGLAWDPKGEGKMALRAGFSLSYDANLGAVTSQSRNVFPTFVPLNLDPSFLPPSGLLVNSPRFMTFIPTQAPLIRPGTLNTYNLTGNAFATSLGTLFIQAPPFPNGSLSSNGLAFTLPEKNLKTGSAQQFVASVEKQLGDDHLVSIAYVGTRGLHLTRFVTPNAGLVSTPLLISQTYPGKLLSVFSLPPAIPSTAGRRPQTGLGAYTVFQNTAGSDYHSLQLSVEQRLRRGLQYRANWTWSHAIDEVSDPFDGRGFFSLPQKSTRMDLDRASANFDARHRVTWYFVWDLPKSSAHSALRGWKLAATGEFQTGRPFTVNASIDRNRDGNLTDRLNSTAGIGNRPGNVQPLQLVPATPAANLIASQGQDGRVGRNSFRADGIGTVDLAIWRRFKIKDTSEFDLRLEMFNCLNRTHFGIPVRILESPGFGRAYDTQVNPRSIRLVVKLSF